MAFTGPDALGRPAAGAPPRRKSGTSSGVPQDQRNPVQAKTSTPRGRKPAPSGKGGRSCNALEPTEVLGPKKAKAHGAKRTPSPRAKGKVRATAKAEGSVLGRRQKLSRLCWQNPACRADGTPRPRAKAEGSATRRNRLRSLDRRRRTCMVWSKTRTFGRRKSETPLRRRNARSSDRAGNHRVCAGRNRHDRAERNRHLRVLGKGNTCVERNAGPRAGGKGSALRRRKAKSSDMAGDQSDLCWKRHVLRKGTRSVPSGGERGPDRTYGQRCKLSGGRRNPGTTDRLMSNRVPFPLAKPDPEVLGPKERVSEPLANLRGCMGQGPVQPFGEGWGSRMGQPRPFGDAVHEGVMCR